MQYRIADPGCCLFRIPDPNFSSRIRIKELIYFLVTILYDYLIFILWENDYNVPSEKSNKKLVCLRLKATAEKKPGSGSVCQRFGSADPDPYQNVTDPEHCTLVKYLFGLFKE